MGNLMKLLDKYPPLKEQIEGIVAAEDESIAREYLQSRGLHTNASSAGISLFPLCCLLCVRLLLSRTVLGLICCDAS